MEADLCFGFSSTDWSNLARRLDQDKGAWAEAIGVFERRMKERFFTCIDALVNADTKPYSRPSPSRPSEECVPGFSIMALCCLVVETLQGFREGPSRETKQQFFKFLKRPCFHGAFADDGIAKSFVDGIRHGILHEAETRKWIIRSEGSSQIVEAREDGYALNRKLFYDAVKQEFRSYLKELSNPANRPVREKFIEQMNDICKKV